MNHLQSLKFESKLYAMVKDKMEEMQQHNMSWIEVNLQGIGCSCFRPGVWGGGFEREKKEDKGEDQDQEEDKDQE